MSSPSLQRTPSQSTALAERSRLSSGSGEVPDDGAVPDGPSKATHRIRRQAAHACDIFKADASHPALRLKKIHDSLPIFSVRVSRHYRAVARLDGDVMIWFWIGSHAAYDRLVAKLRRG